MDRIISQEERIRRAESIYQGRRAYKEKNKTIAVNVNEKNDFGLFKKVIIQILISMLLYFIFYLIQTTNYTFSEGTLLKLNEILNYDVDFNSIYNQSIQYIKEKQIEISHKQETEEQANEKSQNVSENIIEKVSEQSKEENTTENLEQNNEETKELSSIDTIKQKYSFVLPLKGTITSEFGTREVMAAVNVSTNHQGIDIGSPEGTNIKSSTDGIVIYSGYSDSYRKLHNYRKWRIKTCICTL